MAWRLLTSRAFNTFAREPRMIIAEGLTERQSRERQYYDEFVKRTPPEYVSFAPVEGRERRPWNPYWYVADIVRNRFAGPSDRLLDVGCGPGYYSVQFAHVGYDVYGFDISPGNVETAGHLAARYGMADRTHFALGVAERLDYADHTFDVIVGIDVLHHVEIRAAISECLRVLKRGGVAIFKEPIAAPLVDGVRNTRFGRAIRSNEASFERHITHDERKLTGDDIRLIKTLCHVEERRFRLASRIDALVGYGFAASRLEIFDRWALKALPVLGTFAGNVVLICRPARSVPPPS